MDNKNFEIIFNSLGKKIEQDIISFQPLCGLVSNLNPQAILEIGFRFGGTARMWQFLVPEEGKVVSVDDGSATSVEIVPLPEKPEHLLIIGDSHNTETIEKVKAQGIFDFLFLDGDHSYEGVKADYLNFSPLIRKGGIIAFHDHGHGPILKFWNELEISSKKVISGSLTIGWFFNA